MSLVVDRLTGADRPRWVELWRAYLAFYRTELPGTIYDSTWSRLMRDVEIHGLAARGADGIVGITHFMFHPHTWSLRPACYLQDLYVDAAVRGTGAGRALIEAVADRAGAGGATRLYWLTQEDNAAARRLYDRLARTRGFIRYEYPLPAGADHPSPAAAAGPGRPS